MFSHNCSLHEYRKHQTIKEKVIDGLNRDLNAPVEIRDTGNVKGRRVFALQRIERHTYICEHKTTNAYKEDKFHLKQKQYEENEETSATITFPVGRKKFYYDNTRRFNQIGWYLNHSKKANVKPHCAVFLRGKSRIGMYTIKDVLTDEELEWEYGISTKEMPWEQSEGNAVTCVIILGYYSVT